MRPVSVGLFGLGRIGRNVFRLLAGRDDIEVVAVADIADPAGLTYLLKYDSIYGRFPFPLALVDGNLDVDGKSVPFQSWRRPEDSRWDDMGVDIVVETTSQYRDTATLKGHLESGASKVILTSSPETPGEIPVLLRGVNDDILKPETSIVALGSNTSNALAPILLTIDQAFGLERAYWTTVKAMSNSGRLADVPSSGFRTSRAAGENIIPAETNSPEIIAQVLPELEGRMAATALNVPVIDGSTVDLVAQVKSPVTVESLNGAVKQAIDTRYSGIIEYAEDPIVSSDVRDSPHSGVYDSLATMVTSGTLTKTITWFNNGWGYSQRVVEVIDLMASHLTSEVAS